MSLEAMKMAISTLEGWANVDYWVWPETAKEQAKRNTVESITALRQAIEQAEKQEPVAWMVYTLDGTSVCVTDNPSDFTPEHHALPLYTAPPPRQPLTDEMLRQMQNHCSSSMEMRGAFVDGWLSAEAAHGISIMSTKAQEE
jgi:hypothetical protein